MQFATTILALAAVSSAAVLPRSPLGSWYAQVTVSPDHSVYLTAKYTSDAYPDGLRNACVDNPFANPPVHRCDHVEFDFTYDGAILNLTQTIEEPEKQTVFGSAWIPYTEDLGDGRIRGEGVVPVIKAIA